MEEIQIGQRVLITGAKNKRKGYETIPKNARGVVYSISHGAMDQKTQKPSREPWYNVQEDVNGHKHSLILKEFKPIEPILQGPDPAPVEPEEDKGDEGDGEPKF